MNAYLPELSLLALLVVFVIGAFKKNPIQIGLLGLVAALMIGRLAGFTDTVIMGYFPSDLFIRLLCILFFFAIPQSNGAIELLARKMVSRFKCGQKLMPFVLYLIGVVMGTVGMQSTATNAIYAGVAVSLALSVKGNPQLYALAGTLGVCCGVYCPINEFATNIAFACQSADLAYPGMLIYGLNLIAFSITFIAVYFVMGGHRVKTIGSAEYISQDLPKFNYQQTVSLIGVPAVILLVLFAGLDVGWAALIVGIACILLKAGNCGEALKGVSLNLLIMICGIGTLVNLIGELGGFTVLSNLLSNIMSSITIYPLMCLTSSIFTLFTLGKLVILTLVPTLPQLMENIPGVASNILVSGVSGAALIASVGPLSTTGALIMASLTQQLGAEKGAAYYTKQLLIGFFCAIVFACVYFLLALLVGGAIG